MILGMTVFTFVHVLISLIGILSGLVVAYGLVTSQRLPAWTAVFLATTVLTSVTGFGFVRPHILPSHIVGIISLVLLAAAILALYVRRLSGVWRLVYVIGAVGSLYLNVFVLVVQSFQKVAPLHALAPTGSETPFKLVQGVALILFVALGVVAARKFHPPAAAPPA